MLLLAITVLSYSSALTGGYIWDDDMYLTENKALTSVHGLARIWTTPNASPQYYPMVFTTFWIERHLWGLNPFGYHLVNVLLHASVACLLYFLLLRLEVPGAWFVALVFAVHPVEVETAAWISERKNVLSGVFYMLSAIAFLHFFGVWDRGQLFPREDAKMRKTPSAERVRGTHNSKGVHEKPKTQVEEPRANCIVLLRGFAASRENLLYYFAGLAFFICALLSKTVTCTLPAALLIVLWWKRGRVTRTEALSLAPLFALGAGMGLLTAWLEKTHVGASGAAWSLGFAERLLVAGRALCFYAWKLLWPLHLSFNYERWAINAGTWWQYLYLLAAAAVLLALWAGCSRIGRGPLAAALFFAASLFPALGFFDVFPFRYSYVADHFQYLASIGPITLVVACIAGYVLKHHEQRLKIFTVAAVVVVSLLAVKTWRQGKIFADPWTLWNQTLASNPESSLAHNNIGSILARQGKHQEALDHFAQALKLSPSREIPHYNMGFELATLGRIDEAIEQYEESLKIRPNYVKALNNLGSLLAQKGRIEDAVRCWTDVVEIDPDYTGAHSNLLMAYSRLGDSAAARREYDRIKVLDPAKAEKLRNMVKGIE